MYRWAKSKAQSSGIDFFGVSQAFGRKPYIVWLQRARRRPIRRHIKVRSGASHYDPVWKEYSACRGTFRSDRDVYSTDPALYERWRIRFIIASLCKTLITKSCAVVSWKVSRTVLGGRDGSNPSGHSLLVQPRRLGNCRRRLFEGSQRTAEGRQRRRRFHNLYAAHTFNPSGMRSAAAARSNTPHRQARR